MSPGNGLDALAIAGLRGITPSIEAGVHAAEAENHSADDEDHTTLHGHRSNAALAEQGSGG
jgi:hypothetical protein